MDTTFDEQNSPAVSVARRALGHLNDHVGTAGFAAMAGCPGLAAAVDQHCAAIRSAIADTRGGLSLMRLAAYADGVADTAARHGWSLEQALTGDWSRASWPLVRLLAVCHLARSTA